MLKTKRIQIVDDNGRPIVLKGVNLGGWLMMEGYILHASNLAVRRFKTNFAQALGKKALGYFERSFQENFITKKDFKNISQLGFNCIRLPFHYRLIERTPYRYDEGGLKILDQVLTWAQKYKMWIVLDLHGAAGCQNHDWHSDSLGSADLWRSRHFKKRTFALWEFLADRYKDRDSLAGYDLLNEVVLEDTRSLNDFYKELIRTIRRVDKRHILFVEGNKWATDLNCLEEIEDNNYVFSIHSYEPAQFVFNLIPHMRYPDRRDKMLCNKDGLRRRLLQYQKISGRRQAPIFVGEFGVNYRNGFYGEDTWVGDMLQCFREFGFHWTYWTYKAVKNGMFPDGIYSYYENPPWVNRAGPLTGWDTYHLHWPFKKSEMIRSWRTEQFKPNTQIIQALQDYVF